MITSFTKYRFKGNEYNSLKEIQDVVHNTIGEEVLDKINRTIDIQHKDILKLFEILCSKEVRNVLTECYNVTYEQPFEWDESDTQTINILDKKF